MNLPKSYGIKNLKNVIKITYHQEIVEKWTKDTVDILEVFEGADLAVPHPQKIEGAFRVSLVDRRALEMLNQVVNLGVLAAIHGAVEVLLMPYW